MSDDLADLPLKSLELPSKTVAKLKPLGIKTVRDLYAKSAAELAAAGLVERELGDIEDAASTFGVTWSASPPKQPAPAPATPRKAPAPKPAAKSLALPGDVTAAWAADPESPPRIDLASFAPYVDATGRHFKTPPPSPVHLRLIRKIAIVRSPSIGGDERIYAVGLVDVSQLPAANIETTLVHLGNLFADVLVRIGVKPRAQSFAGCAVQLAITAKDEPRARALAEVHARWIGDRPPYLRPVPAGLHAIANAGLAALG